MEVDRKTYVLAIDVLKDYKDIILTTDRRPIDPNIDLDDAHLVIPEIVIRDLSKLAAKERYVEDLLNELRSVAERTEIVTMRAVYWLHAAAKVKNSNQLLSVLPVQKDLLRSLPFRLSEDDIDDQTIATAIGTSLALGGLKVNDSSDVKMVSHTMFDNVKLLTNDAGLAIRAHWYGIQTSRYNNWRRK